MSTPEVMEPSACTWCGIARRGHGRQYADAAGWHAWEQPSQEQILARMKARRLQLAVAQAGAFPVPMGGERTLDVVEEELTGVNLALWEGIEAYARLRLALASAQRGRRELRELVRQMCEALNGYDCPPPGETPMGTVTRFAVRLMEAERQVAELERTIAEAPASYALMERARVEADGITRRLAPSQVLREDEPAVKCRCGEPGVDPYACEAEDCTHEFSELNPFGGGSGPVEGHDAKVSRACGCGFRTTVWHVADGSAEAELHEHVVRVHGGVYLAESGGAS